MKQERQQRMVNILFYNHTATVSGAERVLLLLIAQLDKTQFSSVVLCPTGNLQTLVAAHNTNCVTVQSLEARFTWRPDLLLRYLLSFWRVILAVRTQVKNIAPDLIHANSIRAGLVMSAATLGLRIPIIWHLHDLLPYHPLSTVIRWAALLAPQLQLLAVSAATAQRFRGVLLRMFAWRAPITTILNCADPQKFQPDAAQREITRATLGIAADAFVVGTIGQITARKNQHGVVRAFTQIAQTLPTAQLLIVGEPLFTLADQKYFQQLQQMIDDAALNDAVRLLGARADVPAIMQAVDVLVVNSLAEPCGLVVLEGMASGLPVIATNVGGNPEMMQHGVSGWLVPVNDDAALTQAIIQQAQTPPLRHALGTQARQRIEQHFTPEIYLAAVQKFYLLTAITTADARRLVVNTQPS